MQLTNEYAVSEVFVEADGWLAERTLAELDLPDEGVLVLAIQRADGRFDGAPRGDSSVHAGDTVILYGRDEILTELSSRPADYRGDQAHREAAEEYRTRRDEDDG